jgi:hypothetical protein
MSKEVGFEEIFHLSVERRTIKHTSPAYAIITRVM